LSATAEAARSPVLAASLLLGTMLPAASTWAQVSPQVASILKVSGARVDALTILGADFGFSDGNFDASLPLGPGPRTNLDIRVTKLGGDGDIGDPMPLGSTGIGWQPRLQGSMGYLESSNHLGSPLAGDTSELDTSAIEFGGGARFWTSEHMSFALTMMALYGHTGDTYAPQSAFGQQNLSALKQAGLIDWSIDTLTLRPALNAQYILPLDRARITLSSDVAAFLTRSIRSPNNSVNVAGDSGFLTNKIDLDIPLGIAIDDHELRSGGYLSRTELFGELKNGLAVQHLNEVHGRIVLDFLNKFWKVQWMGLGASYIWGPNIGGWTWGADVAFRF
jgi:hypothetical protein